MESSSRVNPSSSTAPSRPEEGSPPTHLRLMTYNIKALHLDPAAVAEVIRAADPDVLGIQEPARGWTGRRKMARLARATGMRVLQRGGAARTTALLVRDGPAADGPLVVEGSSGVRLPMWGSRARPAVPIPRGYARAVVGGVRLVVVHLSLDERERARHVGRVLDEVRHGGGAEGGGAEGAGGLPCIVVGDLNELPFGPAWARLTELLVDAAGLSPQPTFSARRPRKRIDAVLVDPRITVRSVDVPDDEAVRRASDHRPIVVELEVPSPSS